MKERKVDFRVEDICTGTACKHIRIWAQSFVPVLVEKGTERNISTLIFSNNFV